MLKRCFHNHQVVNAHTNEVEQTTHYYPYGGIIGNLSSNQEAQKYKYSGKALAAIEKIDNLRREREALAEGQDRTYGLDLYDFHARLFNPALPVFDRPDPLAEEHPEVSPYTYCIGSPIMWIDPTGMIPEDSTGLKISDHIYKGEISQEVDGYRLIDILEKNSLRIGTYVKLMEDGGLDVVVANAGTNTTFSKDQILDFVEDVFQRIMLTADMKTSMNYTMAVKTGLNEKDELTCVGHSKGGAEAAMNAIVTNSNALHYGPAPISPIAYGMYGIVQSYRHNNNATMKALHIEGCLMGPLYLISSPIKDYVEFPQVVPGISPIGNHTTETMRKVLR